MSISVTQRPRITRKFAGGNYLRNIHGDRYRASDNLTDLVFLQGKLGDALSAIVQAPSIISGLNVSQGSGDSLNITAGIGLLHDAQNPATRYHNYDGSALSPDQTLDPFFTMVYSPAVTNMGIPGATLNGVAVNYVKASVVDSDLRQRNPTSNPLSTYYFLTGESLAITVDTVAPTADELLLATFTGVSLGVFSFLADPDQNQRAKPFGLSPAGGLIYDPVEFVGSVVSGTHTRTIIKIRNKLAPAQSIYITEDEDSVANNSLVALTRGNYYGGGGEVVLATLGRVADATNESIDTQVPLLTHASFPAIGLLGAPDTQKWALRLLSGALEFGSDVGGSGLSASVAYKTRTYATKARIMPNGDVEMLGSPRFKGGSGFFTTLANANGADRVATFQDRDGTVAYLDDVQAVAPISLGDFIWKMAKNVPSASFPFFPMDTPTSDLLTLNWPQLVPYLRAIKADASGVTSFSFTGFTGSGTVVTLQLASNAANQALLDALAEDLAVHGGTPGPNWRSITIESNVNDLAAGDYPISAVDNILLTISFPSSAVTTGAGTVAHYPYVVSGDMTKARWYQVAGRAIMNPSSTKLGNFRRRYRLVKHKHTDSGHSHTLSFYALTTFAFNTPGLEWSFNATGSSSGTTTTGGNAALGDPTDSGTGAGVPSLGNENEVSSFIGYSYIFGGKYVP